GYRFTNYTSEQGLPDDEVNDLLETRGGTYWIATSNGLCRYNPKGSPLPYGKVSPRSDPMFVVYRVGGDQMTSIIKTLYEDRSGTIWIGTWRGLYRLEQIGDQATFHFTELGMPASEPQNHIVRSILEDRKGALWLATDSGLYKRSPDGTVNRFTRNHGFSSEKLIGLIEDRQDNLWVGDRYGGLYLLVANPSVSRPIVARQYATKDGLGCVRIVSLYEAADGRIWIGADCGLAELLPDTGGGSRRVSMVLGSKELTDPRVWALAEDGHGNLWIGTASGAVKVARGGFTTYTEADGLGSRVVCSIMETRSGELCVYTKGDHQAFINRFDGKRFIASKLNLPSHVHPDECGLCLQDREDRWWIFADKQLLRYPKASGVDDLGRRRPEALYPEIPTRARRQSAGVYENRRGELLISIGNGGNGARLFWWDQNAATVQVYAEADGLAPGGSISFSAEDKGGNLWIGFGETGLVRYTKGRFKLFTTADGVPAGTIHNLFLDSKGRLWILSSRSGLARIDDPSAERPVIVPYTVAEGLSSNKAQSITEDSWGRLYIGTDHSLDRLDLATGRIRHFTTADGLANNHVIGGFRDSRGALWFGADTGLSRFIPEPDHPRPAPVVLINGLQISGGHYPVSDLGEAEVRDLEFARGQSNIRIDFAGISFGVGEVLHYQHKLEGADHDWSALTEQRTINFANLAPGRYRFLVQAVNADGVMSEIPASFSFTILSPIWQRWWFLALAATMAGLAGSLFYRFRVSQLLKLERVRTRIATDLHDDIGANLTRISVLSEVARRQGGDGASPVSGSLQAIAEIARESVASMSDIVWAINPQRDSLIDLTRKMRQHAEEVFMMRGIELKFVAPDHAADLKLGIDVRRNLYLIFKEAVNNAARHSDCARAEIELHVEGARLRLTISDDGRGFDPAARTEGNGLISMRRRAADLGGELSLESRVGAGSRVRLTTPLARSWAGK
ncbi:MAG TPA: two-component regulator propeller domain-containing protein, partial [Blastocatellia bacterium]|nr:two-component regulator propeller domain-containing protein [Blastocatellia bacterium]